MPTTCNQWDPGAFWGAARCGARDRATSCAGARLSTGDKCVDSNPAGSLHLPGLTLAVPRIAVTLVRKMSYPGCDPDGT
jgi:hypothetical protein